MKNDSTNHGKLSYVVNKRSNFNNNEVHSELKIFIGCTYIISGIYIISNITMKFIFLT